AVFDLIRTPWGIIWVQYADPAQTEPPPTGFSLMYDGWTFIWDEFGGESRFSSWQMDAQTTCMFVAPSTTAATFRADAEGTATFDTGERVEVIFVCEGSGTGSDWTLVGELRNGFQADGKGTAEFFQAGNLLFKGQGTGSCAITLSDKPYPVGFNADGKTPCRFMGAAGVDEECLTPSTAPPLADRLPNYA